MVNMEGDPLSTDLRMVPVTSPTLGQMSLLPVGTEVVVVNISGKKKQRSVSAMIFTEEHMRFYSEAIAEHGAETLVGVDMMFYLLPDDFTEGPLE